MNQTRRFFSRLFAAVLIVFALLSVENLHAQTNMMPIGPHNSSYSGMTRGFWFIAPTDFYIVGARVPTDASTAAQNIQIMRYNTPVTVYGTTGYDFTTLAYWYNVPGTGILPCQIMVHAGDIIGVLGARGNTGSTIINSYGNANVPSNVFGYPTTLVRHGTQFTINDGIPAGGIPHGSSKPTWTENSSISRTEIYYAPPCEIPPNMLEVDIVDASGSPIGFTGVPSNIWVKYVVQYPVGASNVTIKLDFREIGNPTAPPAFTTTINATKTAGQVLVGQQMVSLPSSLPPGYYLITPTFTSLNSCTEYQDTQLDDQLLLIIPEGATLCSVWPGDVNNDGPVNYADRKDLNRYIFDANLRSDWLTGPKRFRNDAATNPMTYLAWEEQPGIPWSTPEGCYMDSDGNGVVNNFDYIAIKMNWMRSHGVISARRGDQMQAASFDLDQNFPNPFNPETTLRYSLPERSQVRLVVSDMLGRVVSTLVDDAREAGVHGVAFDASGISSGQYLATIQMTGIESGMTFSKTVKMTLSK
ncbi:MAG: hypothetical protein WBQ23_12990 [Bacteroidota bacterium]